MKAVLKAAATMDQKINSTSPFLKLMGRRVLESVNPATERLNTLDAILYQARQSKRDLMGLAAWEWLATPSTISNSSGKS